MVTHVFTEGSVLFKVFGCISIICTLCTIFLTFTAFWILMQVYISEPKLKEKDFFFLWLLLLIMLFFTLLIGFSIKINLILHGNFIITTFLLVSIALFLSFICKNSYFVNLGLFDLNEYNNKLKNIVYSLLTKVFKLKTFGIFLGIFISFFIHSQYVGWLGLHIFSATEYLVFSTSLVLIYIILFCWGVILWVSQDAAGFFARINHLSLVYKKHAHAKHDIVVNAIAFYSLVYACPHTTFFFSLLSLISNNILLLSLIVFNLLAISFWVNIPKTRNVLFSKFVNQILKIIHFNHWSKLPMNILETVSSLLSLILRGVLFSLIFILGGLYFIPVVYCIEAPGVEAPGETPTSLPKSEESVRLIEQQKKHMEDKQKLEDKIKNTDFIGLTATASELSAMFFIGVGYGAKTLAEIAGASTKTGSVASFLYEKGIKAAKDLHAVEDATEKASIADELFTFLGGDKYNQFCEQSKGVFAKKATDIIERPSRLGGALALQYYNKKVKLLKGKVF